GLTRKPNEESFQRRQCRKERRLAQTLLGPDVYLIGEMRLKTYCLLLPEGLEVLMPGVSLESTQRLRGGIDGLLALAHGTLQIGEIGPFCPDISGMVRLHVSPGRSKSHLTEVSPVSVMCQTASKRDPRSASNRDP